jgi:hypothetical protein
VNLDAADHSNCCIQGHQLPVTVVLMQEIMIDMNDKNSAYASRSRLATATARPGPASERARVWHALLLLPTSQLVHRWSTL